MGPLYPMNKTYPYCVVALLLWYHTARSQEPDKAVTVSLFAGAMNYQGDLNPSSFTFSHTQFSAGVIVRKPMGRWFAIRAGAIMGKVMAADRWNRDYLKPRNLSFTSSIQEAYAALEFTLLDIETNRFTPYVYGGVALYHFNPWTRDNHGNKTYLKPLGTEGQGLPQYPDRKPYQLTQTALAFGGGFRFAVSPFLNIGVEMSQRKTFTDYLDDLSSSFVDEDALLQARGAKAVELAYRGDELPGGSPVYPAHGSQRGTPSEMDWYYYTGITFEFKLQALTDPFRNIKGLSTMRCPRIELY